MMLCLFAPADDDALVSFPVDDDDEPLPQYITLHNMSLSHFPKHFAPTHLIFSKSMRPSPDINSDIQNLSSPHQA